MAKTPVGEHGTSKIEMDTESGMFSTVFQGVDVRHKTLSGLKTKLDNMARLSSRQAAVDLKMVAIDVSESWNSGEQKLTVDHHKGTFAGIHAPTGHIRIRNTSGHIREHDPRDFFLFRADDPALGELQELAEAAIETDKAARIARKNLDKALARNGFKVQMEYGRRSKSTERAAELEGRLIDFLQDKS